VPEGLVEVAGTGLFVEHRGAKGAFPIIVLHGGPGLDHHMFGDYLDPLTDNGPFQLILVDQRGQGRSDQSPASQPWTIRRMADDVTALATTLGLSSYAVLGHSFGAFVALQHAVDAPGAARASVISSGLASVRWLETVESELAAFEPIELREQVASSWAREQSVQTETEVGQLWADQLPFQFADPRDPRIRDYLGRLTHARYAPEVLRVFAQNEYGGIEVEDRLGAVPHPVLVLSGRYDRTCKMEAGRDMASRLPDAEFVVFEKSGHMSFVEESDRYVAVVADFLKRKV